MSRKRSTSNVTSYEKHSNYEEILGNPKFIVSAKNSEQKEMLNVIKTNTITFVRGPAGTGKTFLAVTYALQQLFKGKCEKIVFSRPVVEAAGEKLGFLPGDMTDKIDPYMMPIFDALLQKITKESMNKLMNKNGRESAIRVIPLAYMRGVTFRHSFVICDEMQNSTPDQMRMLLTRLGEGCKMIICGDTRQTDIESENGLEDAFDLLEGIDEVGFVNLTQEAIVRHPLIYKIEGKYEERSKKRKRRT